MLIELAVSTVLVLVTVLFHGLGLSLLAHALHVETLRQQRWSPGSVWLRRIGFKLLIVIGLFVLHGIEIWFYGFVYLALDAVEDLRTAVYFSSISYATIGFSDAAIADQWVLIAAIEGINGILLLGWSTAFFVTVVTRLGHAGEPTDLDS